MYYLAKFCRICIQTSENLVDIDEDDSDSISFREKLKACTEMVISREGLSTQICLSCVNKLRISYQFRNMCENSTSILQQYLAKLLNTSEKICTDSFLNSELQVGIESKLPRRRRKRIGKEERCSLLRKLLSKITQDQLVCNTHIKELSSLCERIPVPDEAKHLKINENNDLRKQNNKLSNKGDLKNLLNFTKEYDFGFAISSCNTFIKNVDLTPLEELSRFTETFFFDHFNDFRETILLIGNNIDFEESDDEDMFHTCTEIFEEVCVKQEYRCESPISIKTEVAFTDEEDYDISSNFVQACYDGTENEVIKTEPPYLYSKESPILHINNNNDSPLLQSYLQQPPLSYKYNDDTSIIRNSVKRQRTFWPYSVKCRTRGKPFINPQLKDQFLARNFKCSTCNRQFKSPGYLKAHCSKLRH